jgi:hypothetical protein
MSIIVNKMWSRLHKSEQGTTKSKINAMIVVDGEVTVAEIDEALRNIRDMLVDRYGNRLSHQKKELLLSSVDDLLDARLNLTK